MAVEIIDSRGYAFHNENGLAPAIHPIGTNTESGTDETLSADVAILSEVSKPYYAYDERVSYLRGVVNTLALRKGLIGETEDIIRGVTRNEFVMDLLAEMFEEVVSRRNIRTYPLVLAVFLSQMPLDEMRGRLRGLVEPLNVVDYKLEPLTRVGFCSKSEGYLADAIKQELYGTDGSAFITKVSKTNQGMGHVGSVGSVCTYPMRVSSDGQEGVVIPYVWYGPADWQVRQDIQQQVLTSGKFHVPGSTWKVMRQFNEFEFRQSSGFTFDNLREIAFYRRNKLSYNENSK